MTKSSAENISLKNEIDHLKQELSTTRDEVQRLTRRLEESEGLYTRVKSYSDDLRRQLDQAGEELTYYKAISQNDEAANPPGGGTHYHSHLLRISAKIESVKLNMEILQIRLF